MFQKEKNLIETEIRSHLGDQGIPSPEDISWSPIPFSGEWGISTSFFQTAALEARSGKKINVPQRAQEIANLIAELLGSPKGFARVEAVKGYLNLYYSNSEYSQRVVDSAIELGKDFGRGETKGQRVMVEFSQPNTHKAMHVGHLRNMMLGAALSNILEFAGYEVVRANYIGDFGRDVLKWIWNYQERHMGEEPTTDSTKWMGELYSESNAQLETDQEAGDEAIAKLFTAWEAGDKEIHDLWKKTRQWSLDGFDEIYAQMGISFDRIFYESEMESAGKEIVDQLIKDGIAVDERDTGGPVIVKIDELLGLENETFKVLIILRSDGTALYSTWDLALAQKKFEEFDLDLSIYVVDVRQSLHFKQVFKTLEIAGFKDIAKAVHLPYEIVNLPGNVTMKSREGTVVLLEDLIREAKQRALQESLNRNPDLPDKERELVAEAVGMGAIKYPMLARDNTKVATFDWDSALDFNGHAAPYIQYAHVRANSLLNRMEGDLPISFAPEHDLNDYEVKLIEIISRMPEEVQRASRDFKTLQITNLAYSLAKAFNEFYNNCPVLKAESEVRDFRLRLVAASKEAIANSLALLGVPVPEVM